MRDDTAGKCTSAQEIDMFGVDLGHGQYLQISLSEVKSKSRFDALHADFQDVAPGDAKAWLEKNSAVLVADQLITQTVIAVSTS